MLPSTVTVLRTPRAKVSDGYGPGRLAGPRGWRAVQGSHITGRVVAMAEVKGCGLEDLEPRDLAAVDVRITEDVFNVLGVNNSVRSRKSRWDRTGKRADPDRAARELFVMTARWIMTFILTLTLGLSVLACGKKPRDVKSPEGSPKIPTQYPTRRYLP